MRVLIMVLCAVALFTSGVSVNHAYLASRYGAAAVERTFALYTSALTYGGAGLICLTLAFGLHVVSQRRRRRAP